MPRVLYAVCHMPWVLYAVCRIPGRRMQCAISLGAICTGHCAHSQYFSPGKENSIIAYMWEKPALHRCGEKEHHCQRRPQGRQF